MESAEMERILTIFANRGFKVRRIEEFGNGEFMVMGYRPFSFHRDDSRYEYVVGYMNANFISHGEWHAGMYTTNFILADQNFRERIS